MGWLQSACNTCKMNEKGIVEKYGPCSSGQTDMIAYTKVSLFTVESLQTLVYADKRPCDLAFSKRRTFFVLREVEPRTAQLKTKHAVELILRRLGPLWNIATHVWRSVCCLPHGRAQRTQTFGVWAASNEAFVVASMCTDGLVRYNKALLFLS